MSITFSACLDFPFLSASLVLSLISDCRDTIVSLASISCPLSISTSSFRSELSPDSWEVVLSEKAASCKKNISIIGLLKLSPWCCVANLSLILQILAELIDDVRLLVHGGQQFPHLALHLVYVIYTILSNLVDQVVDLYCCKLPRVLHLCTHICRNRLVVLPSPTDLTFHSTELVYWITNMQNGKEERKDLSTCW